MANTIQIKRSTSTATPTSLAAGELAYSENSLKLFVGESGSGVRVVGGEGAFLRSDANDTFNGNLVVTGSLTVQGTTTTVESNTIAVGDNIIVLNNDETGTPSQNGGIEIERGTSDNALWQWNEANDYWEPLVGSSAADIKGVNDLSVGNNASITGDLAVDGVSNLDNVDIDGTLVVDGSNISLDSTSTLNIDNSNTSNGIVIGGATSGVPVNIGHSTSIVTIGDDLTVTGDLTVGDNILPDSNAGATIGAANKRFTNVYGVDGNFTNLTVGTAATLASAAVSDLTSGRIVLAGTSGELQDNSDLTYNTGANTLSVSKIDIGTQADLASAAIEDLTAGRVVLAGTGGEIEDSGNLTFNGSTLAVTGSQTISSALTVSGAFTSLGIDDNASGTRLQVDNTNVKITASGVTLGGYSSSTKSVLDNFVVDGGTF